jgi:hypothetical protein
MTINKDCPLKTNIAPTDVADLDALLADLPAMNDADIGIAASFASDLSPADIAEIMRFDSPALKAVEAEQERRRAEIAARSATQARKDYADKKKIETGEGVRPYKPTSIAPRHKANGCFQFETEEEYQRRYDRERKQLRRPKFVPLTEEEKKAKKKASNAKRSRS